MLHATENEAAHIEVTLRQNPTLQTVITSLNPFPDDTKLQQANEEEYQNATFQQVGLEEVGRRNNTLSVARRQARRYDKTYYI